jgi:hypothetical protein
LRTVLLSARTPICGSCPTGPARAARTRCPHTPGTTNLSFPRTRSRILTRAPRRLRPTPRHLRRRQGLPSPARRRPRHRSHGQQAPTTWASRVTRCSATERRWRASPLRRLRTRDSHRARGTPTPFRHTTRRGIILRSREAWLQPQSRQAFRIPRRPPYRSRVRRAAPRFRAR